MTTGTVKWFNNAKGYGFILPEDEEIDVFAHYSAIEMDGYKTLKAGQRVQFELVDGEKGKHASCIKMPEGYEPAVNQQELETAAEEAVAEGA